MSGKNKAPKNIVVAEPEKGSSPNSVSTLPVPVSTDGIEETSESFAPVVSGSKGFFGVRIVGYLGFGKGSGSEALAIALSEPAGRTKEELNAIYSAIRPGSDSRSSVSVFIGDVARPFLSDSGSTVGRSLVVEKSGSGRYRFNPDSLALSIRAIEKGILAEIKKLRPALRNPKNPEYVSILGRYGFGPAEPTEDSKK